MATAVVGVDIAAEGEWGGFLEGPDAVAEAALSRWSDGGFDGLRGDF